VRSLGARLFVSYLGVLLVSLVVLFLAAILLGPPQFERRGGGMGPRGPGGGQPATTWERFIRTGMADALILSSLVAIVAAAGVSVLMTRRIVRPVRQLAAASHRLADGHYGERVPARGEDELAELAVSFNTMADALEQTETRRRELLGDVAHELRTPLAAIGGYMEGLTDERLAPDPEIFLGISRDVTRLQRIVSDLEELSRLEAGALSLDRKPAEVDRLIGDVVDRLRGQAEDKGLSLEVAVERGLPQVRVDPDRIQQVLLNLIGNAIQYTSVPGRITVSARSRGGMVEVRVVDPGIGIPPEHLPHVFERFYRVDRSRARAGGGSGLGLTIARHIVEAHGGRIWAESPGLGRGSTFVFSLPLG
jgi:signal transduction histidine kinase